MPYSVRKKGSRYEVVNTATGDVKARSTSKAKAERQLRILKGIERGWEPSGEKDIYTRRINGKRVKLRVTGGVKSGKAKRG